MICITGDVHHASMDTTDQQAASTDIETVTEQYVEIAATYDVKVTLFVTGKFCREVTDPRRIDQENVEIGGHTWSAFQPRRLYDIFERITGNIYGPRLYQRWDIGKTLDAVESTFGHRPTSWRTHAYRSNQTTLDELSKTSVSIVSDEVTPEQMRPTRVRESLMSLPINVMPDHEHLYHGARTREHVESKRAGGWEDSFTSESYMIGDYYNIIVNQIEEIIKSEGIATILLHPICMKVADDFEVFERLCELIYEEYEESIKVSELNL
jgi:hypothetical protein